MTVPLGILAIGALLAGLIFSSSFIGAGAHDFWQGTVALAEHGEEHGAPLWLVLLPTAMMALGFVVAWYFYIVSPETPRRLAEQQSILYRFLLNKWYFDEIYDFLFVRPAQRLGHFLWKFGDGRLIDGFGPDGVSARVIDVTRNVVRLQTGYLYHYAFVMLIGLSLLITWALFAR
jgi:NADH-quinone oxidoreductase subunit L